MKKFTISIAFGLGILFIWSQSGSLKINVMDEIDYAFVDNVEIHIIQWDSLMQFPNGDILIPELPANVYSLEVTAVGYDNQTLFEIEIAPNTTRTEEVYLRPTKALTGISIQANTFAKTAESPNSLRSMTSEEITRSAGGNRDISKVVQSLPGVTSTASFRNDLLIRGGGPNENRFYIDDIETPIINHFATQGASGGPRGMINVNFLKEVQFYSSAFPANRGNALSSVFEFEMKKPSQDPFHLKGVLGLDDMSISTEGTLGENKKFNYLISLNRSNLQLLFKALDLPFLPSYTDMNLKLEKEFDNGDRFYIMSIWAVDRFKLNFEAEPTEQNIAIIERLPVAPQDNYTVGIAYKHRTKNGFWNFIASRNFLHNTAIKYYKNIETPENLLLNYRSNEGDYRLRIEREWMKNSYTYHFGFGYNFSHYYNKTFNQYVLQDQVQENQYQTQLNFNSYFGFGIIQKGFYNNRLKTSLGIRLEGSDYNQELNQFWQQFSPRLALAYQFLPRTFLNFSFGTYFQLPQYTAMGYRENNQLVNKNTLDYIQNTHWVFGLEYNTSNRMKFTLDGFYKKYKHYPFSIDNGVNLANLGGDFGVVGTEAVTSTGFGRAYGVEFLAQQRTSTDIYGILAYTLSWSQFNNSHGEYIPSAWDARHIVSVTAGKKLNKGWDLGFRLRMQTGLPETPYDLDNSSRVALWNVNNGPLVDYSKLNSERGKLANQLDIRIQKKWLFPKWSISMYADIINIYGGSLGNALPVINLERDAQGEPIIINPQDPYQEQRYQLKISEPENPIPIPYFGIIVEL